MSRRSKSRTNNRRSSPSNSVAPPPPQVLRLARKNGFWVLAEGKREAPAWLVYCATTGLLAFTYTPAGGQWWAEQTKDNGVARTFEDALAAWKRLDKPVDCYFS